MKKVLVIAGVVAVLVVGYAFVSYNSLVVGQENVTNSWAQVESQYQRRFDLIPNLVASVKGILGQEQKVFGDIADARTKYAGAGSASEKASAASEVEGALGRLLVIVEQYPQLNSSKNVQDLMTQIEGTENRISVERMRYNEAVKNFNLSVKRIPKKWVANAFGFEESAYFDAEVGSEKAPKVEL